MNAAKYVILAGLLLIVASEFSFVFAVEPCDAKCRMRKSFSDQTVVNNPRTTKHFRYATCYCCQNNGLCLPKTTDFIQTLCEPESTDPEIKSNDYWNVLGCDKLCAPGDSTRFLECTERELPAGNPVSTMYYGCRLYVEPEPVEPQ